MRDAGIAGVKDVHAACITLLMMATVPTEVIPEKVIDGKSL